MVFRSQSIRSVLLLSLNLLFPDFVHEIVTIDTPEMGGKREQQHSGRDVRDRLRRLVVGKAVRLPRICADRHGRAVGELFVDGMNVLQIIVAGSRARIDRRSAHHCSGSR